MMVVVMERGRAEGSIRVNTTGQVDIFRNMITCGYGIAAIFNNISITQKKDSNVKLCPANMTAVQSLYGFRLMCEWSPSSA